MDWEKIGHYNIEKNNQICKNKEEKYRTYLKKAINLFEAYKKTLREKTPHVSG